MLLREDVGDWEVGDGYGYDAAVGGGLLWLRRSLGSGSCGFGYDDLGMIDCN